MFSIAAAFAVLLALGDGAAPDAPNDTPATVATTTNARRIAAGTAVVVETAVPLSSAKLQRGDRFALRLATPIAVGGVELLPAGTTGIGEVIHADRSHGGGKPGELIVAARYLEIDGRRIALRRYRLGAVGADRTGAALGTAFAIGPFAMFIRGGEIEIPAGTPGEALVAEDVDLAVALDQVLPPNP